MVLFRLISLRKEKEEINRIGEEGEERGLRAVKACCLRRVCSFTFYLLLDRQAAGCSAPFFMRFLCLCGWINGIGKQAA
jgi:hypothetical protein